MSPWMAPTPAGPPRSSALAAELHALDDELERSGDRIDRERDEAASVLVRAARQLVGQVRAPVDRDVLSLLRVAAACVSTRGAEALETSDVAAALTLIAKTVAGRAETGRGAVPDAAGLAHVHATLEQIAGAVAGQTPSRGSSQ
jgi:hypothetical protein